MLKDIFNRILKFFSRIIPSKSSQQPEPQQIVILTIDPMEPFEKAAEERRIATWYDVELTDITQGTIKYKI